MFFSSLLEWLLPATIYVGATCHPKVSALLLNCSQSFIMLTNTGLLQMIVGVLTTCHTQYTLDRSICIFYLIEQHSKFLLHTLQVLYMCTLCDSTNINTIIEFIPDCL